MIAVRPETWHEANQRYLLAALAEVRLAIEAYVARLSGGDGTKHEVAPRAAENPAEARLGMPAPAALDTLCHAFGLSSFERSVLLLCAGMELDSAFADLCRAAQASPQRSAPTFSLALAALPQPHWSALTPAAPLRRWRLIEVGTGEAVTASPLRIDESVLHFLAGARHQDPRLDGLIREERPPAALTPSHKMLLQRIVRAWESSLPEVCLHLAGDDLDGKYALAARACADVRLNLSVIRAADIPASASEREALARLWEREAVFSASALLVDAEDTDALRAVTAFVADLRGPTFLATRDPVRMRNRHCIRLDVFKPGAAEQKALWEEALGRLAPAIAGKLDSLSVQFSLSRDAISATCAEVLAGCDYSQTKPDDAALADAIWQVCCARSRSRLDGLAQRIEPIATWDDIVLPEPQRSMLAQIVSQVRQRFRVYQTWGFARKSSAGLGISALFSGASGTGKSIAAEVLANELKLDLYRIDLSQVISKYIGETEKNLKRVFDAAEEGGAILLFDEADALFGKRSEVRDSHDRYANIEISYLLQRMETYRGLAILTTNLKNALDPAFLRRLRFVIQFPFPDFPDRVEIWRRVFTSVMPAAGLDPTRLARLNVPGGNIRNIALHAAFLAADAGESVRMSHLLRAARIEYAKLERPLTDSETAGWS
jgi:hypothetical protein